MADDSAHAKIEIVTEAELRKDLAACYRLIAHFGMDDLVFTHISARIPGTDDHFLINRHGLMFNEVTASNLVRVDLDGSIVDGEGPVSKAGFIIHSTIHAARTDAQCVLHTHTHAGVAVSCLEEGLLASSQHSLRFINGIGYHDYGGLAVDEAERAKLVKSLGNFDALIMRNHGLLTVGPTIPDAFLAMHRLNQTCEVQLSLLATGRPLRPLPDSVVKKYNSGQNSRIGSAAKRLVWPGLLRLIDGSGYDS